LTDVSLELHQQLYNEKIRYWLHLASISQRSYRSFSVPRLVHNYHPVRKSALCGALACIHSGMDKLALVIPQKMHLSDKSKLWKNLWVRSNK